jgi:hypothetical protein
MSHKESWNSVPMFPAKTRAEPPKIEALPVVLEILTLPIDKSRGFTALFDKFRE